MDLALPLGSLFAAIGLGGALYALRLAHRAARRHLPDPEHHPTLRRAFGIMALALIGYALALPVAVVGLPAHAQIGLIVALSGGLAWTLAAQALRLRALRGAAALSLSTVASPRAPGAVDGWVGLGATLVGLGLALAAALSGGLIVALR